MYIYCMLSCIFSCIFRIRYVYSLHAFVYISISLCIFIACFRVYFDFVMYRLFIPCFNGYFSFVIYIHCMLSSIFQFRYVYSLHAFVYISISLCILVHALVNISISLSIFIVCFRGYVDYIGFLRPYMHSLFIA